MATDFKVTRNGTIEVAIRSFEGLDPTPVEAVLRAAGHRVEDSDSTPVVISLHNRPDAGACREARLLAEGEAEPSLLLVVEQAGVVDVRRAIQAGAHGVVTFAALERALIPSIEAALAGQIAIPYQFGARAAPRLLTVREKQILGLVVMGMTNAAIASQLYLAESTVKSHLSSAFSKLGVSSRSEATTVILDPRSAGLGILTIPGR
jgi:two-component system, NarL family, response regulator YdfI